MKSVFVSLVLRAGPAATSGAADTAPELPPAAAVFATNAAAERPLSHDAPPTSAVRTSSDPTTAGPVPSGPKRPPQPTREALAAADQLALRGTLLTREFDSFAHAESARRKLLGGLSVGTGVLFVGAGLASLLVTRGTTAQGAGTSTIALGATTLITGVAGLARRGPLESLTASSAYRATVRKGWDPATLQALMAETRRRAIRERRSRRAKGGAWLALGSAAAIFSSVFLGLELSKTAPNGVRTANFGQMGGVSFGMIVSGVVGLARPSTIEVLARGLPRGE